MGKNIIPYNPKLKEFAKELRKNSTLSEVLLWNRLKSRQMRGYTFNRQKPLDQYIVDFYCKPLNLVIEIDGWSHDEKYNSDMIRQKHLESFGLHILRFHDHTVKENIENVLMAIDGWIQQTEKTSH
ncbi:MAG: endonuclease domain-containing protein [SAR324 cluster bacterium]|nr:endonuclease domain-containing protein [SAR324 cluster bacterium]